MWLVGCVYVRVCWWGWVWVVVSVAPDGSTLQTAFEHVAIAMFGYMTDLETVEIDESCNRTMRVKGQVGTGAVVQPRHSRLLLCVILFQAMT